MQLLPSISIIIPVKNGAETLGTCLKKIVEQKYAGTKELIVLDSGSNDNSVEIAISFGAKVINIPSGEFNHGLTRNTGVAFATSELLYFTVQDAYLADENTLQKMAAHFVDLEVQSVTGMQAIPHDLNKNPALWFKRSAEPVPETYQFLPGVFQTLNAYKQKELCCWDNVNAMYRKSALLSQPFLKANLSEDMIWAKQALQKSWKIVRDPSILVYHYHHHLFKYNFRVNYAVAFEDRKVFGILPKFPRVVMPLSRRIYRIFNTENFSTAQKMKWSFHNANIFLAHTCSVLVFRTTVFLGGEILLEKSLQFFCNTVPQGVQQ